MVKMIKSLKKANRKVYKANSEVILWYI